MPSSANPSARSHILFPVQGVAERSPEPWASCARADLPRPKRIRDQRHAEALPITIRNHVSSLYHKIGVYRRAVGIIWARERGSTGNRPSWPPPYCGGRGVSAFGHLRRMRGLRRPERTCQPIFLKPKTSKNLDPHALKDRCSGSRSYEKKDERTSNWKSLRRRSSETNTNPQIG
jgi:hypothetical protein